MSEIQVPGRPPASQNPLTILAASFNRLLQPLEDIAKNTKPKAEHVYAVAKTLGGWGTYCLACSNEAEQYVWPCNRPSKVKLDVPPEFFTLDPLTVPSN